MKKLEDRDWWPELVALKDVMSLRELSARFGAAPAAISNALKRNGLDRTAAPPGPRDKRDEALKEKAAQVVAAVEGGTPAPEPEPAAPAKARGRKAAPAKAAPKAKSSGKKAAVPAKAAPAPAPAPVAAAPAPAAAKPAKSKAKAKAKAGSARGGSRIEAYSHLLGVEIDRVIAEKAGVSVSAVTNYRKRHGISSATRGEGAPVAAAPVVEAPAAPAVEAPAVEAPAVEAPAVEAPAVEAPAVEAAPTRAAGVGYGYKVAIGDQEYVVVARDIAEAASIALAAGRGEVTRVELLGTAIG